MFKFALLLLIFFLPFAVLPLGASAFETPKVLIFEVVVELFLIIKLLSLKKVTLKSKDNLPLILLACLFLLSLVHVTGSSLSIFFGNAFRLQGVFLLWNLILFALLFGSQALNDSFKWFYLVSFCGIFVSALLLGFNPAGRAIGVLGEPNALASTLVIILPFVFLYHKSWIRTFALLAVLIIIYLTRSRSALLAIGIEALFYLLAGHLKYSLVRSTTIIVAIIVLSLLTPFLGQFGPLKAILASPGYKYEDRSDIWRAALKAGTKNPLFGEGFGNLQNSLHEASSDLKLDITYSVVDSSHNFLLDYWVEGGLVGLGLILGLCYLSIKNLIKANKPLELIVLLASISAMLFNPVTIVILIVFWWLIGKGITVPQVFSNRTLSALDTQDYA